MYRSPLLLCLTSFTLIGGACDTSQRDGDRPSRPDEALVDASETVDSDGPDALDPELALRDVPDAWIGAELGLAAPELDETGAVPMPTPAEAELLVAALIERGLMGPSDRGDPDELGLGQTARSGAALGELAELAALPDPEALYGQSGVDDTRVCFGENAGCVAPKSDYPFNVIGTFGDGPGCTGTQIGPVHVITAAHCVRPGGGDDAYQGLRWFPGYSDGPSAAGSVEVERVYSHPFWQDAGEGKYDYALVITKERLVNQWMGYGYRTQRELMSKDLYNRGYPLRQDIAAPNDPWCADWSPPNWTDGHDRLYGDAYTRRIVSNAKFRAPDPISGWNRIFVTAHDTGAGHSGSPHYAYEGDGPWVFGIHRSQCTPDVGGTDDFCEWSGDTYECDDAITYNSQAIRLEPSNVSAIAYWKSLWGVDGQGSAVCLVDDCGGEYSN
ncbi:MAG: trypsin-like serine protease [Nannocystaceae bacterium]